MTENSQFPAQQMLKLQEIRQMRHIAEQLFPLLTLLLLVLYIHFHHRALQTQQQKQLQVKMLHLMLQQPQLL